MVFIAYVKGRESAALGGKLKFIAVIEEPMAIEKILKHIGRDLHAPPIAPARRRVDLFEVVEVA
jgi:hypothetical protein